MNLLPSEGMARNGQAAAVSHRSWSG